MQMSPYRIPILFPESLRSHLFFVKINAEAGARGEAPAPQQSKPVTDQEKPAQLKKPARILGVPSSPLHD